MRHGSCKKSPLVKMSEDHYSRQILTPALARPGCREIFGCPMSGLSDMGLPTLNPCHPERAKRVEGPAFPNLGWEGTTPAFHSPSCPWLAFAPFTLQTTRCRKSAQPTRLVPPRRLCTTAFQKEESFP